jgi:hypothetical protein
MQVIQTLAVLHAGTAQKLGALDSRNRNTAREKITAEMKGG